MKWNHLSNFKIGHYGEPICEIILNLGQWYRRRCFKVERLFLAVPWGSLQFVIVVFPDHTHLLFLYFF